MKKYYAIDWMVEDNFNFDNKEESVQKDILKNEIKNANEINDTNIELIEIENISTPGGSSSIIIEATKNDMIKLGYYEEEIEEFEKALI